MNRRIVVAAAVALLSKLSICASVFGQTLPPGIGVGDWINSAGGIWSDATNWSNDVIPSDPLFDLGSSSAYTVTFAKSEGGAIDVGSGNVTFALNGNGLHPGDGYYFELNPLQVAQGASLTLLGPGTTVVAPGAGANNTLTSAGQLVLSNTSIDQSGGGDGSAMFTSTGTLSIQNGSVVQNDLGTAVVTISSSGTTTLNHASLSASGAFSIGGTLVMTNGSSIGSSELGATGTISGTCDIDNSSIGSGNRLTLGGNVSLSDGASVTGAPLQVSGNVSLASGALMGSP
jgi:hypothetical protein